jgi:hypothetical protein
VNASSANAGQRRLRPSLHAKRCVVLAFALSISSAAACRYNIREIGFVDENQPRFELSVFVHGGEQTAWLPEFQSAAQDAFARSNVVWQVYDETQPAPEALMTVRKQLGPRLPGAVLRLPGRNDGWPVALHATGGELSARLKALAASPARAQLTAAVIDTYGAVLLLRGSDETANAAARVAASAAIRSTEAALADLPKRISRGPRLIEADASHPDEQVIAWALGADGKNLTGPVAAVVYGRGRLAGAALRDGTLTEAKIREQLAIVGADCECTMDHAWMTAGAIPLAFAPSDEARLAAVLGFDPGEASVKAEVSQILAAQAKIAADPAAPRAAGYRETPLEIVTITPAPAVASVPSQTGAATESEGINSGWRWALAAGAAVVAAALALLSLRRKTKS